jgi:hypothetical protein
VEKCKPSHCLATVREIQIQAHRLRKWIYGMRLRDGHNIRAKSLADGFRPSAVDGEMQRAAQWSIKLIFIFLGQGKYIKMCEYMNMKNKNNQTNENYT